MLNFETQHKTVQNNGKFEIREFLVLTVNMSNQYNFFHQLSNEK